MRLKTRSLLLPAPFWARRLPPAALGPGRSPAAEQIYQRLQRRSFPWNQTDRRPAPWGARAGLRAPTRGLAKALRSINCGRQKDRNYNKQRPTTYFGWRRFIGRCSDFIFIIFLFVHVLPCFFANRRFFGANRARCLRARCLGLGARVSRGAERPTGNLPDARSHRFTGR